MVFTVWENHAVRITKLERWIIVKKGNLTKRLVSLAMVAAMFTSVLAGCSQTTEGESKDPASSGSSETSAPEQEREEVELVWYVAGNGPQADTEAVLAEANKYLKEKLNCTLKIIETDFGSYDDKMQMVIGSQETFDLCYTANWSNNFYSNVSRNAFLELDDLVDQYAPDLKEQVPESGWEACKVSGTLYAVPNMQIWAMTNGVIIDKEYVDKYQLDVSKVTGLKDLEEFCAAFKADYPDKFPMAADSQGLLAFDTFEMGYDELAGRHIPGVIMLDDEEMKVVNQFELPQVQEHYQMMYEWNQKGYIRQDSATLSDYYADLKNGQYAMKLTGTVKPGLETIEKANFGGKDVVIVPLSDSYLTTSGITATMTAISRTSENPERAMEFLNLFNTDEYLYNLITQGIEVKHYEKLEGKYIKPIENSGYYPNADWMYGNQFLAFLKEGQGENDWTETQEMNESATPSPALGFAFDSTPVQNELASVNAVVSEYQVSLDSGSVNPETALPEFLAKLKQAGSDAIIAEVQDQLDDWKASK